MGKPDVFRVLLLQIAQELTSRNFEEMKFACDDAIPEGVLEKLLRPIDLFTELEHRDLLSDTNKGFLAKLLLEAGRQKLATKLLGINEKACKLKRSCSLLHGKLPGKVPHFLGRALLCEEIIAHLHQGHDRLVTITGPPGYGKSAVAISIGHEMIDQHKYSVYYVSTRGASSVDSVAFQLLYSMSIVSGDDPISQAHHYFEASHNDILLILDNVEDMLVPELKMSFLKFIRLTGEMAPHVKMIVTSRVALKFISFNMKNVPIPALNKREAAQLIRIFAPQEITNSHAELLGQHCKGIPLLIRAVASLLETNVDPELLIQEFQRSPGTTLKGIGCVGMPPESDLYPCLKICFERLSAELQRHLVALSVFPSSFKISDTSCVLRDISDLQRQIVITQLVDNSFVRPDTEGRSFYAVHSIVQIFCQELLKESKELKEFYDAACNNFNLYFLSFLHDLNEKFYRTGDELKTAMIAFECNKNNIFRALESAIHGNTLVKYVADLLNSSFKFFTVRLSSDEFRRLYRSLLDVFDNPKDKKRYCHSLVSLAFHQFWVMCSCHRPCPKATKMFKEAYKMQKNLGLTKSEQYAECLSKIARANAFDGDLATSVAMVDEANTIVEEIGCSNLAKMSVINDYAAVYSFKEHHKTAIKLREGFLPTAKEFLTDHPSVGTLYEELGSSYEALGDAQKSMECRKEAIRIFGGFLGDHKFTATSYLGLGTTLKSQGNYEEALVVLRKALDIQRKTIGPHVETVITSQEIEKVLEKLGRKNEAKEAARFSDKLMADQKRIERAMEDFEI
ncbi:uncharacterized protein LOC114529381 [Dendronephthya gigantea]|uniref:uncharacterized protein LOC114529381 n=1 Tax=Dendronephthya gigantea TaxID=151771 RepID=UPI00106BC45E|nr:uncharacterized protein LOC114529381 [Dendronephthya gigantea]